MLDQLFNIVKNFGQDTVVKNPEVPNEYNQEVMADATHTIASGFQNILAGGGFQNILDLFKGGGKTSGVAAGNGIGGLMKNPIVTMMVGYFISKLVNKYKMSPSSASNVAGNLIPNALQGLISQTNDTNNPDVTLDNLIGSLTGGGGQPSISNSGSSLQNLLENFTGGGNGNTGGGLNIQNIISSLTEKAQNSFKGQDNNSGKGGIMDLIKSFIS